MSCYSCPKCYFKADCFVLLCLLVTLSRQLPFIRSGSGLSPGRSASDWCLGLQMFMHLSFSECFQSSSLGLVQMENTMSSESSYVRVVSKHNTVSCGRPVSNTAGMALQQFESQFSFSFLLVHALWSCILLLIILRLSFVG